MGMCLVLHTIDDDSIAKLLGDPPLIWKVIAPDDPHLFPVVDSAEAGWNVIREPYNLPEVKLAGGASGPCGCGGAASPLLEFLRLSQLSPRNSILPRKGGDNRWPPLA